MTTPTHKPGCPANGGYGNGVGACVCGAVGDTPTPRTNAILEIASIEDRYLPLVDLARQLERAHAAAEERIRELEDWSRQMVEKAASGGALDGYRELGAKLAKAEERAEEYRKDAERLDSVASEYFKIEPFEMPTGAGDADVGWRITKFYMAKPCERVAAEVFLDDPRAAIDAAMKEKP